MMRIFMAFHSVVRIMKVQWDGWKISKNLRLLKAGFRQKEYFEQDRNRFEMLWNLEERNHSGMVVMDLPAAVKNKLLKIAKDFRLDSISMQAYLQQTHPTLAVRENTPKKQELSLLLSEMCSQSMDTE